MLQLHEKPAHKKAWNRITTKAYLSFKSWSFGSPWSERRLQHTSQQGSRHRLNCGEIARLNGKKGDGAQRQDSGARKAKTSIWRIIKNDDDEEEDELLTPPPAPWFVIDSMMTGLS